MKKFLSILLVLALAVSCVTVSVFAVDTKTVVNGNAENGDTGWSDFKGSAGGEFKIVTPGANGTGHAASFKASGKWQSIAFNFGAAIVDDEANGYKGAGAGTYTITFWAKAEDGAEGKFKADINSQLHYNKSEVEGIDEPVTTFITGPAIELTDEWQEYEVEIEVKEDFLEALKQLYALGKTSAYDLILRLDGSETGYAFGDGEFFTYYVDEVTISMDGEEDANTGDTGKTDTSNKPVGTGDVLPVAFVVLTVASTVALAVTVIKKRELF